MSYDLQVPRIVAVVSLTMSLPELTRDPAKPECSCQGEAQSLFLEGALAKEHLCSSDWREPFLSLQQRNTCQVEGYRKYKHHQGRSRSAQVRMREPLPN